MVVVGSPERGLVGIGRGRGVTTVSAMDAGYHKGTSHLSYLDYELTKQRYNQWISLTNTKVGHYGHPPDQTSYPSSELPPSSFVLGQLVRLTFLTHTLTDLQDSD